MPFSIKKKFRSLVRRIRGNGQPLDGLGQGELPANLDEALGMYASTALTNAQLRDAIADANHGPPPTLHSPHFGPGDTQRLKEQIARSVNFDHMLVHGFTPAANAAGHGLTIQTLKLHVTPRVAD